MTSFTDSVASIKEHYLTFQKWIREADDNVTLLPCNAERAEACLLASGVSARSMLGCVISNTGGILIAGGWLRILGSGSPTLTRSVVSWNSGKTFLKSVVEAPYLLVADDVLGGLFAINGGGLGDDAGALYYFAVDSLQWQPLEMGYYDFLQYAFTDSFVHFYQSLRWKGWESDVKQILPDYGLWSLPVISGKDGQKQNRSLPKQVLMDELYDAFSLNCKVLRTNDAIKNL